MAALGATGSAGEVRATAPYGGVQCGIYDLDKVLVHSFIKRALEGVRLEFQNWASAAAVRASERVSGR